MRMKAAPIQLGVHEWVVRPLTIAQVQAIEPVLMASNGGQGGHISSALAILRVALSRDHAGVVDSLEALEAGAAEISAAVATVLRLGGFIPAGPEGSAAPGEAGAG